MPTGRKLQLPTLGDFSAAVVAAIGKQSIATGEAVGAPAGGLELPAKIFDQVSRPRLEAGHGVCEELAGALSSDPVTRSGELDALRDLVFDILRAVHELHDLPQRFRELVLTWVISDTCENNCAIFDVSSLSELQYVVAASSMADQPKKLRAALNGLIFSDDDLDDWRVGHAIDAVAQVTDLLVSETAGVTISRSSPAESRESASDLPNRQGLIVVLAPWRHESAYDEHADIGLTIAGQVQEAGLQVAGPAVDQMLLGRDTRVDGHELRKLLGTADGVIAVVSEIGPEVEIALGYVPDGVPTQILVKFGAPLPFMVDHDAPLVFGDDGDVRYLTRSFASDVASRLAERSAQTASSVGEREVIRLNLAVAVRAAVITGTWDQEALVSSAEALRILGSDEEFMRAPYWRVRAIEDAAGVDASGATSATAGLEAQFAVAGGSAEMSATQIELVETLASRPATLDRAQPSLPLGDEFDGHTLDKLQLEALEDFIGSRRRYRQFNWLTLQDRREITATFDDSAWTHADQTAVLAHCQALRAAEAVSAAREQLTDGAGGLVRVRKISINAELLLKVRATTRARHHRLGGR